eukprot:m.292934 g.292934  ORF g.292934 m.292934 type:complete len:299 (-) comp17831_c1_seq1:2360-3256(-)
MRCHLRAVFVSDSESVFKTQEVRSVLKAHGLVQSFSPPYQHHRNRVETYIKLVKKTARRMLDNAQLGDEFGSMALDWAVMVVNCHPRTSLGGISAFEHKTGVAPNMSNWHVFGEPVMVSMPGEVRQGLWVGFDYEASSHVVFFPDTGAQVRSVRVRFLVTRWGTGIDLDLVDDIVKGVVAEEVPTSEDGEEMPQLVSLRDSTEEVLNGDAVEKTVKPQVTSLELTSSPPVLDKVALRRSKRLVLKNQTIARSDASVKAIGLDDMCALAAEARKESGDAVWRCGESREWCWSVCCCWRH